MEDMKCKTCNLEGIFENETSKYIGAELVEKIKRLHCYKCRKFWNVIENIKKEENK